MKVSNFRNYFLSVKSSRVVKKGDAQRSRLAAVPVFEKQSARLPKPIRMLMFKFSTKSHYKTVKPKLKMIDK
jgi:hypothetical protein